MQSQRNDYSLNHVFCSIALDPIYYNTLLLSRVYEQKLASNDQEAVEFIKDVSTVAWRNINLIGKIDFTGELSKVDIEVLAAIYNEPNFWRKSLEENED